MPPSPHTLSKSAFFLCLITLLTFNFDAAAVDETIPHPIDERGLLSRVAVKTTQLFRKVEIIQIHNSAIQKPDITIEQGTVIVIENQDNANHRLTFPSAPTNDIVTDINSTVIKANELWGAEFIDPGIYPYHCTLHPDQEHGVVQVISPEDDHSPD